MRFNLITRALGMCVLTAATVTAAETTDTPAPSALQASNILNPNISVIGWFQAEAGHRHPGPADTSDDGSTFQMKEAELAIQSVVDKWGRADFFIGFTENDVALEEGYITWFQLPAALGLKLGKFKTNFGRFNRIHTAETAFADRPLVERNYFGEEGLNGPGASLSWQIPVSWAFLNVDLEAIRAPEVGETPAFDRVEGEDIMGIGRLSGFYDLSDSWNLTLGGQYALGPAGVDVDPVLGSSHTLKSYVYGTDLTLRWKNPRRARYRSFMWTTEALWNDHEMAGTADVKSHGFFSHIHYQFAQRWHTGVRYDWTQFPMESAIHEEGQLAYVTFNPSEFSSLSLQGRHVKRADGADENLGFFKVTFNIGPHGAHPF